MYSVAVIIPVYINDTKFFVQQAIESILSQTYRNFKLFIALDGSVKNEVMDYLKGLQSDLVSLLIFKQNRGLGAVLNDAIKVAKNNGFQFIARMDADDVVDPKRIETQVKYLELHRDVSVLGTQAYIIDLAGKKVGIKNASPIITFKVLKSKSDIIHASVIFRADFFDTVGYYSENHFLAEDYDLWFRAVQKNVKIESISDRLYYFRQDHRIIDRRKKAQSIIIKVKSKYLKYYQYHHLLSHIIILLMPRSILRYILKVTIRPDKVNK